MLFSFDAVLWLANQEFESFVWVVLIDVLKMPKLNPILLLVKVHRCEKESKQELNEVATSARKSFKENRRLLLKRAGQKPI